MKISKVMFVGLGALGTMYAAFLTEAMDKGSVKVIAGKERINKYVREKIYANGKECQFEFADYGEKADILFYCVKNNQLQQAIEDSKPYVHQDTIILSVLNGIGSEDIIAKELGMGHLLYCIAQGMDAVKEGNQLVYHSMGKVCFGEADNTVLSPWVSIVKQLFDETHFPYEIPVDMQKSMWGKLMLNTGCNQAAAVFGANYGMLQQEGEARRVMIDAMREVLVLAKCEGVSLSEDDIAYWLVVISQLDPRGKTSTLQDVEAKRKTEVELFSGTVIRLGKEHGIPTPVNDFLFARMTEMENEYLVKE